MRSVIVDLDDTLIDTITPLLGYARTFKLAALDIPAWDELTQDRLHDLYGNIRVAHGLDRKYGVIPDLPSGELFEGTRHSLESLSNVASLHIVTARDMRHENEITAILDKYSIREYFDKVHYRASQDRTHDHKRTVARRIGAEAIFDDRQSTIESVVSEGVHGYLIDKPWNKSAELSKEITRADDFNHAVAMYLRSREET